MLILFVNTLAGVRTEVTLSVMQGAKRKTPALASRGYQGDGKGSGSGCISEVSCIPGVNSED